MNYTELFILLWLLPVFAQIIIPLIMLFVFVLVKAGNVMNSILGKGTNDMYKDSPDLMANRAAKNEV